MYNYGSEARVWEYEENVTLREEKVSDEEKRNAKRAQNIELMKKKAIRALVVVAAFLAVIMIREAQIDKLCGQITQKENSIHNLNAIITEKEMQLSGQMDINMIEQVAVSRLGMKKPDSSQYVYIDVDKKDGGEILTEESSQNEGFTAFINKAKILLEYLY